MKGRLVVTSWMDVQSKNEGAPRDVMAGLGDGNG
jgi:hypothetical protein